MAQARDELGRLDVWVNNAGADVLTGEAAAWEWERKLDALLAVDLKGTIACSYAAGEVMRRQERGGTIVNMSWDHVTTGMAGDDPQLFSAVKGGVLAFSKSLARALAPDVRVNVLCPGWIETSFGEHADREFHRSVARGHAARALGPPAGRGGRGALPRLARGGVRHRPGDQRQRRRTVVGGDPDPEGGIAMAQTQEKPEKYPVDEIEAKLKEHGLDDWYFEDGWIRRKFNTDGWPTTLMLVNAVGYLCEAAYHHADLSVTWGKLWVKLAHALQRRHHRQGLRAGAQDRGHGALAPGGRQRARGHARTSSSSARAGVRWPSATSS